MLTRVNVGATLALLPLTYLTTMTNASNLSSATLTLNVGLSVNGDSPDAALIAQRAAFVVDDIRRRGYAVLDVEGFAVVQSDTEPTLAVRVATCWTVREVDEMRAFVAQLAVAFDQEAVAALAVGTEDWVDVMVGFLAGPKAEKWGPFNPEFFFLPGPREFRFATGACRMPESHAFHMKSIRKEWL